MTRTMYDSTNVKDIPVSAKMVGYYVDGIYRVGFDVVKHYHPSAVLVPISAIGTHNGIVGDVEPGCIWPPAAAVPWVLARRAAHVDPTVYCNETYHLPLVRAEFSKAKVAQPHYWCSNYDGVPVLRTGETARQYANAPMAGGHFDLSVVADFWPGIDSVTPHPPPPVPEVPLTAKDLLKISGLGLTEHQKEWIKLYPNVIFRRVPGLTEHQKELIKLRTGQT